ncbi:MAG: efflux RND transporter periplasmic adaptor subunit [Kiritimatiellae bacterium]|nr:efflux RND transporter periplasmic adaptor subunit [Kiritimatiellia bacterium]
MKTKKARLKRVIPVVALLILTGVGCWIFRKEQEQHDKLLFYGNVDIRQVRMAFFATGRIQSLAVREGDTVETGQLVAELNAARHESAVAQAEAQVAAQSQVVQRYQAGSRPEEIAEAQARVRAAQAALTDATQHKTRLLELEGKQFVSKQQLDNAESAVDMATANLEALQQAAALAVEGPRKEDIAAAEAQLKAYQAALELARLELADTKLYAPTNGIIQNRILEPGDMASPQLPVFTLALNDPVWVRAYVPEPQLGQLAEGMAAEVTTDSFPGKKYAGWIGFISPTAEFTPKQVQTTDLRTRLVYQMRIYVKNPQNELRLGMPASVRIIPSAAQEK